MSPLGNRNYWVLFGLLGLICFAGLYIPLMDNDAAHHANIALRMYLTGDYVNLVDNGKDYLDKPHLHFWLAALSYKLFGVNEVAYKLPSFLLSIGGLYALYRLGAKLYNKETGRLAALLLATAFAFFVSLSDVRMDAILVAAICFSAWQLVELLDSKKWGAVFFSALGLAIGFSVKGAIGVFVPLIFIAWYGLEKRLLGFFYSLHFFFLLGLFFLFISPVLYCYYLQFNLHPEKIVRGRDHVDGIRFALLGGSTERFSGGMSNDGSKDLLFFFHSFLWAFAPWSIVAYMAMGRTFKEKKQWFLSATILTIAILIGLAGSKLPHYLNISFPFAALLTAAYLNKRPISRVINIVLWLMVGILLVAGFIVNGWLFPEQIYRLLLWLFLLMTGSVISSKTPKDAQPFTYTIGAVIFLYLFLNINFYPTLLEYQGGNSLAEKIRGKVDPGNIYFWKENYSSSFCFYTKTLRKELTDTSHLPLNKTSYIVYDSSFEKQITDSGWVLGERILVKDFEVTKLDKLFLDPRTRERRCSRLVLAPILFFIEPTSR